MRKALFAAVVVAALTYAAPAAAGCWATVDLNRPPSEITAGTTWTAELTVLQHGRNPLPDAAAARPTVTITNGAGERKTFTASPVDPSKGTYSAQVVYPSAGNWTYAVFDDFTSANGEAVPCSRTHEIAFGTAGAEETSATFVAPPTEGSTGGGGFPFWPVTGGLGLVLLIIGGAVFFGIRTRRTAVA